MIYIREPSHVIQSVYFNTIDNIEVVHGLLESFFGVHSFKILIKDAILDSHFIPYIKNVQKVAKLLKECMDKYEEKNAA